MGEKVTICEVGPRDGLQTAKSTVATATKIEWVRAIATGIDLDRLVAGALARAGLPRTFKAAA